jgi:hypothetical protein
MKASVWGRLAVLQGLFLSGCAEIDTGGGEETDCTSTAGTLEGVVYEDYPWTDRDTGEALLPAGHARINISQQDVDPFTAVADSEGHFSVDLQQGVWNLFATDNAEGCVSEMDLSVEVVVCETVEIDIHLTECTLGG